MTSPLPLNLPSQSPELSGETFRPERPAAKLSIGRQVVRHGQAVVCHVRACRTFRVWCVAPKGYDVVRFHFPSKPDFSGLCAHKIAQKRIGAK